ncbi:unnamed protein product [Prunus brigantina]
MWSTDVEEVSGRWEGEVGDGPLVPLTYCDENDICKKLDLSPDMTNVHQALNILAEFVDCAGIKCLVGANSKKISGIQEARDILLRSPLELPKTHYLPSITTRLQSHEQSSAELTQCCKLRPRELPEQRVLESRQRPIRKLVIAPLVKFDTHVEATEASKREIAFNAHKLDTWTAGIVLLLVVLSNMKTVSSLVLICPLLKVSRAMLWMQKQLKSR